MLDLEQSFTSAPSWETYRRPSASKATVGAARCKVWLMKSDCLSFEFLDALSPLIHTLIPTAWASDTCRDQKKKKNRIRDPQDPTAKRLDRIQDP